MPLLIDGHNLIGTGELPGLRLDDPDDEAKLVLRLRAYAARTGQRVTVVFDHGLPGGPSRELSGGGVKVVFASAGHTADGILRERIRRTRDPRQITVVTSDQQVVAAAKAHRVRVIPSRAFAAQMQAPPAAPPNEELPLKPEVYPPADEVDEWMHLFGNGKGKKNEEKKTTRGKGPQSH
jgi:hypothetical protein